MTKKRNKKMREEADSMDVFESKSVSEAAPQAMDTTETGDSKLAARARSLTSTRKGKPMKRTKNASKMNAIAMDTTETGDAKLTALARNLTSTRKGKPMKRMKNVRKMKAVAKAIALSEKYEEKATKNETKTLRTLSAKKLYE